MHIPDTRSIDPDSFVYRKLALNPWEEHNEGKMCLVHITWDCRPNPTATGKLWIYLWKFDLESVEEVNVWDDDRIIGFDIKKHTSLKSSDGQVVIQLENGDIILWAQCWRTPVVKWEKFDLEAAQQQVESIKQAYALIMGVAVIELEWSNDNI